MASIENGKLIGPQVEVKVYLAIEHGPLGHVHSIVMHRTASSSAADTLSAYADGKQTGAHFLLDKSGKVYQTASLEKACWHVGILRTRCEAEKAAIRKSSRRLPP